MKKGPGRKLYHPVRPRIHPGGLLQRPGAGGAAAAGAAAFRPARRLWGLGLPRPDFPCHQLPVRAGHFDSPQLFRGYRRSQRLRHPGQGVPPIWKKLSRTGIVVFDKTGTLTQGVFEVTGVYPAAGVDAAALLETAAPGRELLQTPHLPEPEKKACGKELDPARAANVEELGGYGITAQVDGRPVGRGQRPPDGKSWGLTVPAAAQPGTLVYCGHRRRLRRVTS